MVLAARLLILSAVVLTGCHTAKTAAVQTFRVIDAPARFVRDRIDPPAETTTTTTTSELTMAGNSDVTNPGRPMNPSQPSRSTSATERVAPVNRAAATPRPAPSASRRETAATTPRPSPSASKAPTSTTGSASEFPTARAVPGKPGFVYSIDPKGGMIDVTGYKSGDKAKDPYTHQVFIVP
jgi:hypothetical protein